MWTPFYQTSLGDQGQLGELVHPLWHPLRDLDILDLGTGDGTKMYEFSEKFQGGGGSFLVKKIILLILDLWTEHFEYKKKNLLWFSENGGGVKGRLVLFRKFIPFW